METKEGDESVITPVRLTALQTITIPPIGYQIFRYDNTDKVETSFFVFLFSAILRYS